MGLRALSAGIGALVLLLAGALVLSPTTAQSIESLPTAHTPALAASVETSFLLGDKDGFGMGFVAGDLRPVSESFNAQTAGDPLFTDRMPIQTVDVEYTHDLPLIPAPTAARIEFLTLGIQDGDSQVVGSDLDLRLFLDDVEVPGAFDAVDQFQRAPDDSGWVSSVGRVSISIPQAMLGLLSDRSVTVKLVNEQLGTISSTDAYALDYSELIISSESGPPPFTAYGTGAAAGDVVTIFVDGRRCGEATADAVGNWGPTLVLAEAPCLAEDGDTISFLLNGLPTNETEAWSTGGAPANVATGTVLTLAPPTFQGGFVENGVTIGVWGGGSFAQLLQLADSEGCDVYSFWVTVSQQLVGYFDGAPGFVNAGIVEVYPGELIPPHTVMLVICGDSRSVTPAPFTAYGTGLASGDHVEAFVDGVSCGAATADAAGQWGPLLIAAVGPCAPEPGEPISFRLNGLPTNETETWMEGLAPADLAQGTQLSLATVQGVIDFEGAAPPFAAGAIVDEVGQPAPGGVSYSPGPIPGAIGISGLNPSNRGQNAAMIYDSTCAGGCSGGDGDLRVPGLGNVLIVSEDFDSSDPDDLGGAHGQALSIDFSQLGNGTVFVDSLTVVDVEASEDGLIALSGPGGTFEVIDIPPTSGDNKLLEVAIGVDGVSKIEIVLGGSGAIDNIRFTVVPDAPPPPPPPPPSEAMIEVSTFHDLVRAAQFEAGTDLEIWVTSSAGSTLASTTVTTDADGNARWESVPSLFIGTTVHASDGTTTKELLVSAGPDLGFWDGGTTEEYAAAAASAGAILLRATVGSEELLYIVGAPDFVNQMFVDAFAGFIPAGAEVEMGFADADRDILLVIPFKIDDFVGFDGSLGHDFVCAFGFFAGPQVTLTIFDGPGGSELASVSRPRSEDTICWTIEDTGVDLQPGMRVEVTNGVTTRGDEVFQETLGSWTGGSLQDYTTAAIGAGAFTFTDGTPAEGLTTWVIGAPQFVNQAFIDAHPDGFDPSVVEVQAGHAIRYAIFDDALTPVLLVNEPPPSTNAGFQAFVGADYVCAFNYPTGFDLTLIVNTAPGGSELGRFTRTTTAWTCWTEAETGIDLEAGMEVLVTNSVAVKSATLLRTSLGTWTGGTLADYIAAVTGVGAVAFHAPDPTSTLVYVIGAPDFVNQAFIDAHPSGFDPSVIEVEIRDSDEDSVMFPLYDAGDGAGADLGRGDSNRTVRSGGSLRPGGRTRTVTPVSGVPVPAGGTFAVTPPANGVGLTTFSGGTVGDLEVAAAAAGGVSVAVTSDGRFVVLIVGAPHWVNSEFAAVFEAGVPSGQAVLLIIR